MAEPLSVLIIGCGNIAGGYDERCDASAVLTHAGAYRQDSRFKIQACVEPDVTRRRHFMKYWDIGEGYEDLISCVEHSGKFDVVSLCSPTPSHAKALETILTLGPRCVFAEKPLTGDPFLSREIIKTYNKAGVPVAVNYMRRWDECIENLRVEIESGTWGKVQAIGGIYARGISNCGSHFFDLLHYLVGPLKLRAVLGKVNDGRVEDPTYSVFLETNHAAPVTLLGTNGDAFFSFEIDFVMERGRLALEDLGGRLRCRKIQQHPVYQCQSSLTEGTWKKTGLNFALMRAVTNIADHLLEGTPLVSNADNALEAEDLCNEIHIMATEGNGV